MSKVNYRKRKTTDLEGGVDEKTELQPAAVKRPRTRAQQVQASEDTGEQKNAKTRPKPSAKAGKRAPNASKAQTKKASTKQKSTEKKKSRASRKANTDDAMVDAENAETEAQPAPKSKKRPQPKAKAKSKANAKTKTKAKASAKAENNVESEELAAEMVDQKPNNKKKQPKKAKKAGKGKKMGAKNASTAKAVTDADGYTWKLGTLPRDTERKLQDEGYATIAGVDEAGRGPLAGPVVAAACVVPLGVQIEGVHDSKKLNEEERENLYEKLTSNPQVKYATSLLDHKTIDEINILQATMQCMTQSVASLPVAADYVLVDGPKLPELPAGLPAQAVVKGDSKVYSIAAASIIAKVTRDRMMREYDKQWPQYGFEQHKGYGTAAHMAAIKEHGPCPIHRMTFAPMKNMSD